MKKFLIVLSIILFGMVSLPSNAVTIIHKDEGYIEVSTTETKEVKPDTAYVMFSVFTENANAKKAVQTNNDVSTSLIESLKPLLALDNSDSIQTVNFQLRPVYTTDKDGNSMFQNYAVKNTIKLKTKNTDNISNIIDTAVKNNATNVDNVSFSCEDLESYKTELTQSAFQKLKCMAEKSAKSINEKVTGVKSMRVDVSSISSNNSGFCRAFAVETKDTNASVPIESGTVKVNVSVNAAFYVK